MACDRREPDVVSTDRQGHDVRLVCLDVVDLRQLSRFGLRPCRDIGGDRSIAGSELEGDRVLAGLCSAGLACVGEVLMLAAVGVVGIVWRSGDPDAGTV